MIKRFMLNNAKKTFQMVYKSYFKRYDLRSEWYQLSEYIEEHKHNIGREPFMYEVIEDLLDDLCVSLKSQVLNILHKKDNEWFLNTGQYFFYNLSQWTKHYSSEGHSLGDFKQQWWSKFLEFEVDTENNNRNLSYPRKMLLELTNNCNLNCVMCGIGKNGYNPQRDLSIDLLHSLSENVLINSELIRLNGLGESTIMPNFLEYLDVLSELQAQLEIVTNLTVTNNRIWDKLLENNTNFLISCDSSSSQLFESIRRGANFTSFKKNLKYIGTHISNPLQGQIIFTLMECNIPEITKVIELAAEMDLGGVIINVVKLDSIQSRWMHQKADEITELFQKAHDLARLYNIVLKLPDHLGITPVSKTISSPSCHLHCYNPWEEVYIRYNGDLTACNMLNPYIYGNCQHTSFEEAWNGLNAELFRKFVNTKHRHYYCRDCYYLV
ncbi:MAG: SPASM domain-containing protein [Promethearchaeota archaeon]